MTVTSFPPANTQKIYGYRPGSTKVHRITVRDRALTPRRHANHGALTIPAMDAVLTM
jgi:hypothetical protein